MTLAEKIRQCFAVRRRRKLLAEYRTLRHAEDDLLDDGQRQDFDALLEELERSETPPDAAVAKARADLAKVGLGIRFPALREILDLLLVVGAVAAGIRGLFLQPFRIPTGSMQPTLYGIHYRYKDGTWRDKLPASLQFAFFGRRRAELTVAADGYPDPESFELRDGVFKTDTSFRIGDRSYTLPGDPRKVLEYTELDTDRSCRSGEKLADGYVTIGDHLFVERLSLYLSPPKRGDVMVFNTENLKVRAGDETFELSKLSGYYYIKRLVGLPGDTLKIEDGFLYVRPKGDVEFHRADQLDPVFEKLFSKKGGYQGYGFESAAAYLHPGETFTVPDGHYFMLGDNTAFSMDSRFFGAVPRRNLVGRAFFVFWPCSRRWGIADSKAPLDVPTFDESREDRGRNAGSFRVMYRQ